MEGLAAEPSLKNILSRVSRSNSSSSQSFSNSEEIKPPEIIVDKANSITQDNNNGTTQRTAPKRKAALQNTLVSSSGSGTGVPLAANQREVAQKKDSMSSIATASFAKPKRRSVITTVSQ